MEDCLAIYKLPLSKLEVFFDRVVFTHKGPGVGGVHTVYISDITSVNFKEPTMFTAGYLQVNFDGKKPVKNPVMFGDIYSIPIGVKKLVPQAKAAYDCIMQLISDYKNDRNINAQSTSSSAADEILKYKSLLDMGAITEEEFETKKKQLLNL